MSGARPYNSPLREAQADATRELVLDAAIDLLADEGADALSHRAVARRAEVSAPTVQRHFPNNEALVRGIDERLTERLGVAHTSLDGDQVLAALRTIYVGMEREERAMRAYLNAPASRAFGRKQRRGFITSAFSPRLATLGEEDRHKVLAAIQLFMSGSTWQHLREVWDLRGEEAAHVCHWAMCALIEAAQDKPPSTVPLPAADPFHKEEP
jgi:AcrR family transcriptional regulator